MRLLPLSCPRSRREDVKAITLILLLGILCIASLQRAQKIFGEYLTNVEFVYIIQMIIYTN